MKKFLFAFVTCAFFSTTAIAADKPSSVKKEATATKNGSVDISNGTDVIGSQDAPLVLNVVSWKEKENYLPKNPLTASVLQESLEPIDRDVVYREVSFSHALQQLPTTP
ncbi:MAG: hypothetical protein Q7S87_10825 [Agitococcus sp.]|nr:hypothetical protein [Agitococcus sp.]